MEIVLATNNVHKVSEIKAVLQNITLRTLAEENIDVEIPETADTLIQNALLKAKGIFNLCQKPCISDDSGLEIKALQGRPGVHSAYYAGLPPNPAQNIAKVLEELQGETQREAKFKTVMVYYDANSFCYFEGIIEGIILEAPQGTSGFGYDPIFKPNGYDKTFAEMTSEEKNAISHRAKAVQKLALFLSQFNKS